MPMIVSLAVTVLSLAAMLGSGALGLGQYSLVFKMIASTGFMAMAFAAGGLQTGYGRAVLLALFFSWWGDLFLGLHGWFLFGLVAFLIGHLCFGAAFLVYGVHFMWTVRGVAVTALIASVVVRWIGDSAGDMTVPVYVYMAVISLMVALSIGARGNGAPWWFVAGALLFYVSDLFVARGRFVAPGPINGLIGLPLYYGAQIVFAYTCKLALKP